MIDAFENEYLRNKAMLTNTIKFHEKTVLAKIILCDLLNSYKYDFLFAWN